MGIILTTLILTISGNHRKLSDDEIITKAMELGMVLKEDPQGNLDEVLEGKPSQSPETTPSAEPTQLPEVTPSVEPTQSPEVAPSAEPTQSPEKAPTTEPTQDPVTTEDPTQTQITFTIEKGMSSGKVAELLQSVGLIKDAKEFNEYIMERGKAGAIMIGKYTLNKDATFGDILNAITK